MVTVIDLSGVVLNNLDAAVLKTIFGILQSHYPEVSKKRGAGALRRRRRRCRCRCRCCCCCCRRCRRCCEIPLESSRLGVQGPL